MTTVNTALADEIEALAAKATPGPWEVDEDPTQNGDHLTLVTTLDKAGMMGTWLLGCFHNWNDASAGERRISWKEAETNAALIVALCNNLPAIIAALRAAEPAQDCEAAWKKLREYCTNGLPFYDNEDGWRTIADAVLRAANHRATEPAQVGDADREDLRAKLRNIVSHATGGTFDDPDEPLNSIAVKITAFRNRLWSDALAKGRAEAEREIVALRYVVNEALTKQENDRTLWNEEWQVWAQDARNALAHRKEGA